MSEENYTVEERLEDALSNQIAELDNVKPGSDEYTNISRAIIISLNYILIDMALHMNAIIQYIVNALYIYRIIRDYLLFNNAIILMTNQQLGQN